MLVALDFNKMAWNFVGWLTVHKYARYLLALYVPFWYSQTKGAMR